MERVRKLLLAALAVGFACGAFLGEPLVGPQSVGLPCGECQSGLTCGEALIWRGLPVCLRSCDAGCAMGEACLEGTCQRRCSIVNDCGIRIVEQVCVPFADGGVCLVRGCDGNTECTGSYACTRERASGGCSPVFIVPGYCRRTP